jgi:hypothetical protein
MENSGTGYVPPGAHLVGSVPLRSAEEVFRMLSERLGDRVQRLPDGECCWNYISVASSP